MPVETLAIAEKCLKRSLHLTGYTWVGDQLAIMECVYTVTEWSKRTCKLLLYSQSKQQQCWNVHIALKSSLSWQMLQANSNLNIDAAKKHTAKLLKIIVYLCCCWTWPPLSHYQLSNAGWETEYFSGSTVWADMLLFLRRIDVSMFPQC